MFDIKSEIQTPGSAVPCKGRVLNVPSLHHSLRGTLFAVDCAVPPLVQLYVFGLASSALGTLHSHQRRSFKLENLALAADMWCVFFLGLSSE